MFKECLIPLGELRSEGERKELKKRIFRRSVEGDWQAYTQAEFFSKNYLVLS